jgi:hypothetical protein
MLLREVIDGAIASGYDVAIKPHPRDPAMKFADYADRARISILDSSRCAEDIDYWSYDLILNFGSSVVMEVLASGYPAHDILTIEVGAGLTRRLDLLSVTVICHDVAEALRIMKDRSRPTSPAGLG